MKLWGWAFFLISPCFSYMFFHHLHTLPMVLRWGDQEAVESKWGEGLTASGIRTMASQLLLGGRRQGSNVTGCSWFVGAILEWFVGGWFLIWCCNYFIWLLYNVFYLFFRSWEAHFRIRLFRICGQRWTDLRCGWRCNHHWASPAIPCVYCDVVDLVIDEPIKPEVKLSTWKGKKWPVHVGLGLVQLLFFWGGWFMVFRSFSPVEPVRKFWNVLTWSGRGSNGWPDLVRHWGLNATWRRIHSM